MADNAIKALVDGLNGLLADTLALYLKTKNFHWHIQGREFRDLHLLFDEQAVELFAMVDPIAERVRKNGARTLTSIASVAAKTTVADDDECGVPALTMVERLRDDSAAFVKTLKSLKELAGDAGDNATDGMIDDWTDQAEQRVWFLTSILA